MSAFWLLKTEPHEYSFADLVRDNTAEWDGVTNPTAQKHLRSMSVDDRCIIYHSGDERTTVGVARVVRAPYPDPADASGKRVLVDLSAEHELSRPVPLAEIKANAIFADSPLVRISRLSVVPLTDEQFNFLLDT